MVRKVSRAKLVDTGKLTWVVRAHGYYGDGMLRNKDGIKKDNIRIMDCVYSYLTYDAMPLQFGRQGV